MNEEEVCWQITRRDDNLPTIQILIVLRYTLRQYYEKIKGNKDNILEILDLPFDFNGCCPLCGGIDCARFMGYYHRGVVDEKGTFYKAFPTGRFLCTGKGMGFRVKHRTFSLLPYQLVPYSKYCLPFILKILKERYVTGRSVKAILDYLAGGRDSVYMDLSTSGIHAFKDFILSCINKLLVCGYYSKAERLLQQPSAGPRIEAFIGFAEAFVCAKVQPSVRGPCAVGYDYYLQGGGPFGNGYFLFGTPSQFR